MFRVWENLVKKSQLPELTSWYHGPTLMEEIDRFEPPTRLLDKPLRMRVTDFFKGGIGSSGGVSVAGQIEAGSVQIGEQVMVVPGNETGYIKCKFCLGREREREREREKGGGRKAKEYFSNIIIPSVTS